MNLLIGSTNYLDNSVASWVNEKKDYDYASNSCSGVCGHYTQVRIQYLNINWVLLWD